LLPLRCAKRARRPPGDGYSLASWLPDFSLLQSAEIDMIEFCDFPASQFIFINYGN